MIQTLSDALKKRNYNNLTPVQIAVTENDVSTADLLVSAQTGSGKTIAFGLAIAPTLLGEKTHFDRASKPLALIIAPTRELALQVTRELEWLFALTGAKITSCVGGMDMRTERRNLERGAHIVVATPGRLRDHITRGSLKTTAIKAVVLDEADEMLDLGFRDDLEFILDQTPKERRTLLFSATVPSSITHLAKKYQNDAIRISTVAEKSQHSDIEYHALTVLSRDAENTVINVLRFHESPNSLVFCNTRAMVNRMTTRLSNRGFSVVALSGELSQNERSHALQSMRDGRARVCVATDVAARGIDLPKLDLVIHAELPKTSETMLHRSGRTGRAGRKGICTLIVPERMRRKAERLLQGAKVKAEWKYGPSIEDILKQDEKRMYSDPTWKIKIDAIEMPEVQKLCQEYSVEEIAAAYLRLYKTGQSAPEELGKPSQDGKSKRQKFGPSIWFSITGGHQENADPRRILPMLCKAGNLNKNDIGAIRIQKDQSFVEISKASVTGFLATIGSNMKLEEGAVITQLSTPPEISTQSRKHSKDKKFKTNRNKPSNQEIKDDTPRKKSKKKKGKVEWAGLNKNKNQNDRSSDTAYNPNPKENSTEQPEYKHKTKASKGKNSTLKRKKKKDK